MLCLMVEYYEVKLYFDEIWVKSCENNMCNLGYKELFGHEEHTYILILYSLVLS